MKTEIILLIKYLITIYLLSFIFFIVVQKLHNRLYYLKRKNKNKYIDSCSKYGNASNRQKLNNNKYKRRLTKEERKRIEKKYKIKAS